MPNVMIATHRAKRPEVEAWKFTGTDTPHPGWVGEAMNAGRVYFQGGDVPYFSVPPDASGEGRVLFCRVGDWLVRKVNNGRIKAYTDWEFRNKYEPL